MNKEIVSNKQGIALIVLFIIGSSSVFAMGMEAKKDLWLATILAILMALPMAFIYARLHYTFQGKDLLDIIEICFGKFIGKVTIIILTFFFFYWTADVLVNYGSFISTVSLGSTPKIVPMISLIILCSWGIRKGIEVMGRCSESLLLINIAILIIAILLLIPDMDIDRMRPVFYGGIKPIILGAFDSFSFPFAQIFAFSLVFTNFKSKKSPYTIYFIGLLIGGMILLITSLANILILGANAASSMHYPSYATVGRMNIANVIQRLEVVVATVFVLGGFVKIGILLQCTCKGITKLCKFQDYRFIITPITLLVINLSFFQYDGTLHYNEFQVDAWLYFTFPFQVIIPIIIWITAEIRKKHLLQKHM